MMKFTRLARGRANVRKACKTTDNETLAYLFYEFMLALSCLSWLQNWEPPASCWLWPVHVANTSKVGSWKEKEISRGEGFSEQDTTDLAKNQESLPGSCADFRTTAIRWISHCSQQSREFSERGAGIVSNALARDKSQSRTTTSGI